MGRPIGDVTFFEEKGSEDPFDYITNIYSCNMDLTRAGHQE